MVKNLYRNEKNKKVAGVAAGLADYFEIDPLIIRLLFVFTTLAWGFSIIIYLVMWILVPAAENNEFNEEFYKNVRSDEPVGPFAKEEESGNKKDMKKILMANILILLGLFILLENLFPSWDFFKVWPIVLIGFGAYLLYKVKSDNTYQEAK
jgi:phage shock protein C